MEIFQRIDDMVMVLRHIILNVQYMVKDAEIEGTWLHGRLDGLAISTNRELWQYANGERVKKFETCHLVSIIP